MGVDARKTGKEGKMGIHGGYQVEEILKEQMADLEGKVRLQLEEKALAWVEEECRKRLESLREHIRQEIQREVESWIDSELDRRMREFKDRNDRL